MHRELEDVLAEDRPIVAGPWLGEVGFEVLYWLPFLSWAVAQYPELGERLTALSRGGVSGWYEPVAVRYLDLFDFHDFEAFQARQSRRNRRAKKAGVAAKQVVPDKWDLEILAWAERELGEPVAQIHPGMVHRHRKFISTLPPPAWSKPPRLPDLPERYVALRFYRNRVFRGEGADAVATEITTKVAERVSVVSLNTPMQVDPKHPDFRVGATIDLSSRMTLRDNLAVQAAAIAHAEAFVGTYGGLSYVPPLYGVPSYCYWIDSSGIVDAHLDFARRSYGERFLARPFPAVPEAVEEILGAVHGTRARP